MNLAGVIVCRNDLRKAGICGQGAREFWVTQGWDWRDFIANGIPAQTLWDTGNGYAQVVVRQKLSREVSDGLV